MAAPDGRLLNFPRWGSVEIQRLRADVAQVTPLLRLDGSQLRLIPGPGQ